LWKLIPGKLEGTLGACAGGFATVVASSAESSGAAGACGGGGRISYSIFAHEDPEVVSNAILFGT